MQNNIKPSPMIKQYLEIKKSVSNCLLLFHMGDFYEMFFEDAKIAAKALDIALTKRGSYLGKPIAMCGMPIHASTSYINKLIRLGYKVAICDQVESAAKAKLRKSVVKRKITDIITPGTVLSDDILDAKNNNYLVCLSITKNTMSAVYSDISTGELYCISDNIKNTLDHLKKINIAEILVPESQYEEFKNKFNYLTAAITSLADISFNELSGSRKIEEQFHTIDISHLSFSNKTEIGLVGAILTYIKTTKQSTTNIDKITFINTSQFLEIDYFSFKSLELTSTFEGKKKGSLLSILDKTSTAAGGRLLLKRIINPSRDVKKINKRLDFVETFLLNSQLSKNITSLIEQKSDLQRISSRIYMGKRSPRDLGNLIDILRSLPKIKLLLSTQIPENLQYIVQMIKNFDKETMTLQKALAIELPITIKEGDFIRIGFDPKLDKLRNLRDNSTHLLADIQNKYRKITGVDKLRVKHINTLGYFLEVPNRFAEKIKDLRLIHTTVNFSRFSAQDLEQLTEDIILSSQQIQQLEIEIFEDLCNIIIARTQDLKETAKALAKIDCAISLALVAEQNNYSRPKINDSENFLVQQGRHPVVENILKKNPEHNFIANDCNLSDFNKIHLITGPNMAGKSTYIRQNAIITIMAQIGSFVPADNFYLGIVDKLFCRVGAYDNLYKGQSTFMVEMIETATILNKATDKSLVIIDEIGRGTGTADGIAIAQAILEYLHNRIKCRCLFSTHYQELITLNAKMPKIKPYTLQIINENNKILFMYKVIKGHIDQSYGINVASLAGIPKSVINRAKHLLPVIEANKKTMPILTNRPLENEDDNIVNDKTKN